MKFLTIIPLLSKDRDNRSNWNRERWHQKLDDAKKELEKLLHGKLLPKEEELPKNEWEEE